MHKDLEKWLKENPPRVKLTELEKNIDFENFDLERYVYYIDELDDGSKIIRFREFGKGEKDTWSWSLQNGNEGALFYLKMMHNSLGFNPIGYSRKELEYLNNRYGNVFSLI